MIGLGIKLPEIAARGSRRASKLRLMVASNRFAFGTDFATGDGITGSSFFANAAAPWLGGSGNATGQTGRYHFRRWRFGTTWAPKAGRFLFTTDAMIGYYGVVRSTRGLTIQRVDIRRAADGVLVGVVRFGGATARTLSPGEACWSDPVTDLDGAADYLLDVYWQVPLGGIWPSGSRQFVTGEYSRSHATSDFSLSGPPANSGNSFAVNGADFGPALFAASGWDGEPSALIVSDSTEDQQNIVQTLLARGDIGHIAQGLGGATGGRTNHQAAARYSGNLNDLYAPLSAPSGTTGSGLFAWMTAALRLIGQRRPPWQLIYCGHGKNSIGPSGLAGVQAVYAGAVAAAHAEWPGLPWVQETITPSTLAVNDQGYATEADQNPTAAAWALTANGGFYDGLNDWILAGGGGLFAAAVDVAATVRAANGFGWRAESWAGTLAGAVTANSVTTVTLTPSAGHGAPPLGATLVFEPGSANVDTSGYGIATATESGANHVVTLVSGRANAARRVQKAHAAGTPVRATLTPDGVHQSHRGSVAMAQVVAAAKPAMAAVAAAYTP